MPPLSHTKKLLRTLYSTYSLSNLYSSLNFNSHTRNLTTGALCHRAHHCSYCKAKITKACYDSLHHAYCATYISKFHDEGEESRVRCGERFTLKSGGCGKHPKVRGFNAGFYKAAAGGEICLADFDDPRVPNISSTVSTHGHNGHYIPNATHVSADTHLEGETKYDYAAATAELDNLVEDIILKNGFLPVDFYAEYYAKQRKSAKNTAKAIRRRD
jgi:hypothetical protein